MRVEGLSKRYPLGATVGGYGRLTESVSNALRLGRRTDSRRRGEIWALREIDLEIRNGEVIGFIGRNGAGKSTLLKILSRITRPTEGRAEIYGRVGSLLEVGTGFHPELTGRENIYLNGSILGMRRREVERRFDEIVEFAELSEFLDTPVKRYSSGMYVRLAFAVAAHMDVEILLVDEVLAVGDIAFQRRCLGKMRDVATGGRTVVLVSHDMAAVERLCERVYLLDNGRVVADGDTNELIAEYVSLVSLATVAELSHRSDRKGDGRFRFVRVVADAQAGEGRPLVCGQPGRIALLYEATEPMRNVHIAIAVYDSLGRSVVHLSSDTTGSWLDGLPRHGCVMCTFDKLPFLPGAYTITLFATVNGQISDWIQDAARFEVTQGDFYRSGKLPPAGYGSIAVEHAWHLSDA